MDGLSVIVPCLNEAGIVSNLLGQLQSYRRAGHEVIVVDGGSDDDTVVRARPLADRVMVAGPGRASQMNAGAAAVRGDVFWFLHADSVLPADADRAVIAALADPQRMWGRFDVRLSGRQQLLRVVEAMMNLRSRLTGIATGDQGIFVRREAFESIGGFAPIPLMEDIALSRGLKRIAWPVCLREKLTTSSRRWERQGILRTILLMWGLRLAYALGIHPDKLVRWYGVCGSRTPAS